MPIVHDSVRGEVHDSVIEGHMVTIPEVQVTADLRLATIYVMPMGGREKRNQIRVSAIILLTMATTAAAVDGLSRSPLVAERLQS